MRTHVGKGLQMVAVKLTGDTANLPRFEDYGMTSVVQDGDGLAAVIEINGHRFVVGVDDPKSKPQDLSTGEVCVYHRNGDRLHFKNSNIVSLKTNTFEIDAANTVVKGKLTVEGMTILQALLKANANLTIEGKPFPAHTHSGVTPGGSTSQGVAP